MEKANANSNRKSFRLQNYKIQILKNSDAKEKQLWSITDKKKFFLKKKKKKSYVEENLKKKKNLKKKLTKIFKIEPIQTQIHQWAKFNTKQEINKMKTRQS